MKYFLHDTSAFDDEKISELFINFGYEGLGLFYTTLEKIGKQEKPIKTDVLKCQLRVGKRLEKCWNFMEQIGLLSSLNGETFNNQLLNYSETYQIKKEKTREKVSEWRKKQIDTKNVTSYVPVSNLPKIKESKVNTNKEESNKEKFEIFRKQYPGLKGGSEVELKNFLRKSKQEDIELLLPALEREKLHKQKLKESNSFCPEWKNLSTWINQKCWLQELPKVNGSEIKQDTVTMPKY